MPGFWHSWHFHSVEFCCRNGLAKSCMKPIPEWIIQDAELREPLCGVTGGHRLQLRWSQRESFRHSCLQGHPNLMIYVWYCIAPNGFAWWSMTCTSSHCIQVRSRQHADVEKSLDIILQKLSAERGLQLGELLIVIYNPRGLDVFKHHGNLVCQQACKQYRYDCTWKVTALLDSWRDLAKCIWGGIGMLCFLES